jgi:hypothetical protein
MGKSRTLDVRLFAHPGALSVPNPIHALRGESPHFIPPWMYVDGEVAISTLVISQTPLWRLADLSITIVPLQPYYNIK